MVLKLLARLIGDPFAKQINAYQDLVAQVNAYEDSLRALSDEDLAAIVREEIAKNPALPAGGLMGNVMARVRGKADGKRVQEIIARARG